MGRRPKQNDPWEGYEFIDISPREEGERPRQATSRRGRASPPSQPRAAVPEGKFPEEAIPVPACFQGSTPRQESAGRRNPLRTGRASQ